MKKSLALLAFVPLSACISFAAKPPPSLLKLEASAAVPVGTTQTSADAQTIAISVPSVPEELSTERVPVQASDTSVAYVKDAQWIEPPANLFARLLSDTITSRTGRVVLGAQQQFSLGSDMQLTGELRNFGVVASSSEAVVTYDAALKRSQSANIEKRRFEARVPVATITPTPVGVALNQAANQVAAEVADWIGTSQAPASP